MQGKTVHIVGAGIIGITAALALQRQGWAVTLIDDKENGAQASKGNAAGIAHTDITPMASASVIKNAFKWIFDPLGPLTIRPSYLFRLFPWMVRFLYAARPSAYQKGVEALLSLNGMALPAWERLWQNTGLQEEALYCGCLEVFGSLRSYQARQKLYSFQQKHGVTVELLPSPDAVRAFEPALGKKAVAGAFLPDWVQVRNPLSLCQKLANIFLKRGGKRLYQKVASVTLGVEGSPELIMEHQKRLKVDVLLIACGAYSTKLSRGLGENVPLESERGYNTTISEAGVSLKHLLFFGESGFVISPLSTGLRIGGAVEFAGLEAPPNYKRVDRFLKHAKAYLPDLKNEEKGVRWMGHRPSLPDSLPVISVSAKSPRVFYAFGHGHHGLTQAAVTSELITACIEGKSPKTNLQYFQINRF